MLLSDSLISPLFFGHKRKTPRGELGVLQDDRSAGDIVFYHEYFRHYIMSNSRLQLKTYQ